jgi:hypothetical protein
MRPNQLPELPKVKCDPYHLMKALEIELLKFDHDGSPFHFRMAVVTVIAGIRTLKKFF